MAGRDVKKTAKQKKTGGRFPQFRAFDGFGEKKNSTRRFQAKSGAGARPDFVMKPPDAVNRTSECEQTMADTLADGAPPSPASRATTMPLLPSHVPLRGTAACPRCAGRWRLVACQSMSSERAASEQSVSAPIA